MQNKKVSVIVPIYNAENTVERCILSILHQTYSNIELILVDDGSTDGTYDICKKYSRSCDNVIVVTKDNGGVSAARNAGISAATGVYIMFADADDFLDATMCEKLIMNLEANGSDAVICGYRRVFGGDYRKKTFVNETIHGNKQFMEKFPFIFENVFFNSPCNKLYKKSIIITLFDEEFSIGEDLIFNMCYFKNCSKVTLIEEPLYNYSVYNKESLSSTYRPDLFEKEVLLYHKVLDFCKDNLIIKTKNSLDRVFAKEVYYCIKRLVESNSINKADKMEIIKSYLAHKDVKDISLKILTDKQIKILFFLIKNSMVKSIYNFFTLKKYLFGRIKKRYEN